MDYPKIDKPTGPGWYWYRYPEERRFTPVLVQRYESTHSYRAGQLFTGYGRNGQDLTESDQVVWRGPIPEPTE